MTGVTVEYEGVKFRPSGPRAPKIGEFYLYGGCVYQCNGTIESQEPATILELIDVDPHKCNVVKLPGSSSGFLPNLAGVVTSQAPASAFVVYTGAGPSSTTPPSEGGQA